MKAISVQDTKRNNKRKENNGKAQKITRNKKKLKRIRILQRNKENKGNKGRLNIYKPEEIWELSPTK